MATQFRFRLNNGTSIPGLGLGTSSYPLVHDDIKKSVTHALHVGYRHFDTASLYRSERPLGDALSEAFKSGLVKREEVFVTSKLWSNSHDPDDVLSALQESLRRECPVFPSDQDFLPVDIQATWQALEKCVDKGLTKAIGVSNFSVKKLQEILTYARILPAVNQVEFHPFWQQKKLRGFCNNVGIHVTAYSPLGSPGMLVGKTDLLNHPTLVEIGENMERPLLRFDFSLRPSFTFKVILRWGLEEGVSLVPKSYSPSRIENNFDIWDWNLTKEDHDLISNFEQKKLWRGERWCNEKTRPYKSVEDLWDGEI